MKLWRIAAETRSYAASDLSGAGAASSPGRWNAESEPIVYSAPTIAMSVLETAAHVDDRRFPLNTFLVEISVPDQAWEAREQALDGDRLPPAWPAIPPGRASIEYGSAWLRSLRSAILLVPSVIVPEEAVALINPRHADSAKIRARVVRQFEYNKLRRGDSASR